MKQIFAKLFDYPDKQAENLKRRNERGGSKFYYQKDKHNQAMKTHRTYKHKTLKNSI